MSVMQKIEPETRDWLPLSHAQRGVWLDAQLIGDRAAYQLGALTEIAGDVDPGLARQAVRVIMGAHDGLRLRVDRNEPRQWFEPGTVPPFRMFDLSAEPAPEASLASLLEGAVAEGFALGEQPLFKVDLIKLGADNWRLLMLCHHLLADGVAIAIAQRHWLSAYNALAGEPEDEDGPIDGGELVAERPQHSSYLPSITDDAVYAAAPRYGEDMAYWQKRLTALPPLLFEDRPAPMQAQGAMAAPEPLIVDAAAFAQLETAVRAIGSTTHRALVSILALALSRRYGKNDLIVGMALHRRDYASRHVIGMFAGMIAVRCRIDHAQPVGLAVESLSAAIDADLRHQRLPIDALGRALAADGTLGSGGRKGLFDVAVTIMPSARAAMPRLAGALVRSQRLRFRETTPLALHIAELPEKQGIEIGFGFDPAVLDGGEVRRFRDTFAQVLKTFTEQPTRRVSTLDPLTPAERLQLQSWSAGTLIPVPDLSLPDLFEARSKAHPDAIAVLGEGGVLSYDALDRAANRVAARLRAAGVAPQAMVGVALPRSIGSVVALLGILKAECVYLPLDPVYPDARLAGMIEDARPAAILTDAAIAPRLPGDVPAMLMDTTWPLVSEPAVAPKRAEFSAQSLAYVIYTSGSSGRPKGVVVSHGAAVNLAFARREHDPIGPGDRILAAISVGSDVSIGQLLLPLLSGAAVAVCGDMRGVSPAAFWETVANLGVTHINHCPSFLESVLDHAPVTNSLKQIMLGGEPFSGALAARIGARLGVAVVNMYGPTEACIDATAFLAPRDGAEQLPVLPIGRPLPNYTMQVLDRDQRPVGIGAEGELYIGGAGLAQGYLNLPEATAHRFIDTFEFGRIYRTGDRATWREDGNLMFLGRIDAQVKIRGFRIEPGEIEAALRLHPALAQVAVIARPNARGQLRLLGYASVAEAMPAPTPADLRQHLERLLPAHMIPDAVTLLPQLPVTPNGKLDDKSLPDPAATGPDSGGTAPRTDIEHRLARLYQDLLGLAPTDIEVHFFEAGGHSLLATQLASRLRAELGIELPIRVLFEAPRIIDLAPRVEALVAGLSQSSPARPALQVQSRPEPLPLSFAQERLWFLSRLDPQSAAYNIPTALRLEGMLDVGALQAALTTIVGRHESLRTRFAEHDGEAVQIVMPDRPVPFEIEDLPDASQEQILARAEAEAGRPFDLGNDPLLRVRLLRLAANSHVALLTMHHIVSDGWSSGVLLRELAVVYEAERVNGTPVLPPLPVQYADYAIWQRGVLAGAEMARQIAFWQSTLAGAPETLTMPADFPRRAAPDFAGDSQPLELSATLSQAIQRFAQDRDATTFAVLAAAWAALLARWSGQDDIVVGTPIANRTHLETEPLIGFFVNTIALRADLSDEPSFAVLVDRLQARLVDAQANQEVPFDKLVDALNPVRDLGRHPIFQTMVVAQNAPLHRLDMSDLTMSPIPMAERVAKFDLTLNLIETASGFGGAVTYATSLFSPQAMARLAKQFVRLLDRMIADADRPVSQVDLLDPAERQHLLSGFRTAACPAEAATIPERFEWQVAQTPDALAVVFGETRLTYAALDRRANQVAHALIAQGAGPERPVCVTLSRSENLVIAALAVMKAGAVYMPADPSYPADRIAGMIKACSAVLVIADAGTSSLLPPGLAWLNIDTFNDAGFAQTSPDNAERVAPLSADNLAYIVHTSGSTGQPKGAAVSHRALLNLAAARLAHDPLGPGDRVLATLSIGFDVSVGQLVTPLLRGATVVVANDLATVSGADFWRLIADQAITHINGGPAYLDAALETPPPATLPLKRLMLGGEPMSVTLAHRLTAALPGVEIFNIYGPTETCIDATAYKLTGREAGTVVPIGRPLPGYRTYILDRHRQPVGVGIVGELYVGGSSLARGYIGQPALTAERFLPDPFLTGERVYRTGDLARWNQDGQIEFFGRFDKQVKIRGFRIELGEIEEVLRRHPAIGAAAVVARGPVGGQQLIAYVVLAEGIATLPLGQVQANLSATLPQHMLPAAVIAVNALPMNRNGKLDLNALPDPTQTLVQARMVVPPRNATDTALRDIWQAVLNTDTVGIDDNFFSAGGHSLLALRVAAACKTSLGIDLPIAALFRNQTIRQLSDFLALGAVLVPASPLVRLGGGDRGRPLFCVHPVSGLAVGYAAMASILDSERPLYGLQAAGIEVGEALAPSLQKMAMDYVDAVRLKQSQGPYSLLGHSFGGLVAHEMTRILEASGETVEHLIMLDTSLPGPTGGSPATVAHPLFARAVERDGLGLDLSQMNAEQAQRIGAVTVNNIALAQAHSPSKITASLTYVEAGRLENDHRSLFWMASTVGKTRHFNVACDHYDMLRSENLTKAMLSAA